MRCLAQVLLAGSGGFLGFCFTAVPASAHAFGQRYDLPVPLLLYLVGAAATVLLSFVMMALLSRGRNLEFNLPEYSFANAPFGRVLAQVILVALLILVVTAGFLGVDNPQRNVAPVMVWIIGWIGIAYICALIGDIWEIANPWDTLFRWFGPRDDNARDWPAWLGMWPAVFLLGAFAWLELISEAGESPRQLAFLIVMYSAITWLGMATLGRRNWLRNGEAFAVIFALFGRFAPLCRSRDGGLALRMPAVGLLVDHPVRFSQTAFVLLALSTVTFDGFLETPAWVMLLEAILDTPFFLALEDLGLNRLKTIKTLAMLVFFGGFLTIYLMCCRLMALADRAVPMRQVVGSFVLPLVPIAIAYHLAHYLSYLLISGQGVIPLMSDPFGFGWDLLGTADYRIDIGIVGARFVWNLSIVSIVIGHLLAVYLSHAMALRLFADARAALRSQIPMLVLMIGYTMISLWILSQPVVSAG